MDFPTVVKYEHLSTAKGILCGGTTGLIELVISYPLDFIKTKLQLKRDGKANLAFTVDLIKGTYAKGLRKFYPGFGVIAIFTPPKDISRYGSYGLLKDYYSENEKIILSPTATLIIGCLAGMIEGLLVVTPAEAMKVKFVTDSSLKNPQYNIGLIKGCQKMIKHHGIIGLYNAVIPTMLKHGTNQGIRCYIIESLKTEYTGGDKSIKVPKPILAMYGVFAGIVSVLVNNPMDFVKTRMQSFDDYKGTMHCIRKVQREEGLRTFYRGAGMRLIRVIIDGGLSCVLYTVFFELLK